MKKGIIAIIFVLVLVFSWSNVATAKEKTGKPFSVETKVFEHIDSHEHPINGKDGPHSHWVRSEKITVNRDLVVTGIKAEVVNAPGQILHHAMLYKVGEQNDICPNIFSDLKEIFAVSMNTISEPVEFKSPYALFLPKGTELMLEVMEHTAEPPLGPGGHYHDVSVRVTLETVTNSSRNKPLNFQRLRIDDSPCAIPPSHEAFTVPMGAKNFKKTATTNDTAGTFTFKKDGSIVLVGGNLWPMKGGKEVSAVLNKRTIASFKPENLFKNWIWNLPTIQNTNKKVKAGDVIRVSTIYSNPYSDKPVEDASGMIGFYYTEK